MKTRTFKDAIYEQLARMGKSLGSGPRLEILMALDAADTLRRNGFEATRFEEGIVDWRARGLHVAVGAER